MGYPRESFKIQAAARRATEKEENEMSNSPIIDRLIAKTRRTDLPEFKAGDTVRVHVKIKEGEKERVQVFEGLVIAKSKGTQPSFIEFIWLQIPLHFGTYWGMTVKVVWALAGLAIALLTITGALMYWNRALRRKWKHLRSGSSARQRDSLTAVAPPG